MTPYICTNLDEKRIELAIVDDTGAIAHQYPLHSFLDVLRAYHAYRTDEVPSAPLFSTVEPNLRRQWENLHNYQQEKAA